MKGGTKLIVARGCSLAVVCLLLVAGPGNVTGAEKTTAAPFRSTLDTQKQFQSYARVVRGDLVTKFCLDVKTGQLYFFDVNLFPLHRDFIEKVMMRRSMTEQELRDFRRNYAVSKPSFILGYLTYHKRAKTWDFGFWEGDQITAKDIRRTQKALLDAVGVHDLPWRAESPAQELLLTRMREEGFAGLTNDDVYMRSDFQALSDGQGYGRLVVVPPGTSFESLGVGAMDIVILQETYADLPPVAGIISASFGSPLSHVNLRAQSWGVPNLGLKDAAERYAELNGSLVFLSVDDDRFELREATIEEQRIWVRAAKPITTQVPPSDLSELRLKSLELIGLDEADAYGAKVANLGALGRAGVDGVRIPKAIALPFYYYRQHLEVHGLDALVDGVTAPDISLNDAMLRQRLASLQQAIQKAALDPNLLAYLALRIRRKLEGGLFVRSSTNAEDLKGFNGAGLYDTVPNVQGDEDLEEAIKKVWASIWNYRAYRERERFGMDHRAVYAAVMVQEGIDATAAGVLVTKNLFDPKDQSGYTINAKKGLGIRVMQGTALSEQVVYDPKNKGMRVVSRSDDEVMLVFAPGGGVKEVAVKKGEPVLNRSRTVALGDTVKRIEGLYPWGTPLDIEWLFAGEQPYIVQVRPYVRGP